MLESLYTKENKYDERTRSCPDLNSLDDDTRDNWHTMGAKLLPYVNTKFTIDQKKLIAISLLNEVKIRVCGVYSDKDHLHAFLSNEGLKQIPFENGKLRLDRKHNNQSKSFNFKRPFFIRAVSIKENIEEVILVTFPSKEYTSHYAETLYAFIKLNIQSRDSSNESPKVAFPYIKIDTKKVLTKFLKKGIVETHFPSLMNNFGEWSGIDQLVHSGVIQEGDIAIIGYVEDLRRNLIKNFDFEDVTKNGFVKFGLKSMFSICVLNSPKGKRSILVGFEHSFWGRTAAKIAQYLALAGVRDLIYVAKAGSFTAKTAKQREGEHPHIHYLSVISNKYSIWEKHSTNPNGIAREVKVDVSTPQFVSVLSSDQEKNASRNHISVPTVVGEDWYQSQTFTSINPNTIDNEISFIAEELTHVGKEIGCSISFAGIHFITDFLVSRHYPDKPDMSKLEGLDTDVYELKSAFLVEASKILANHIEANGMSSKVQKDWQLSNFNAKELFTTNIIRRQSNTKEDNILHSSTSYEKAKEILNHFNFDDLNLDYIDSLKSLQSKERLTVSGESGVGKSVVAESSYVYLYHRYMSNNLSMVPVFIDLSSYEKMLIDGGDKADVLQEISTRLKSIHVLKEKRAILLIDGIDAQSPLHREFKKYMSSSEFLNFFKESSVISFVRHYLPLSHKTYQKAQHGQNFEINFRQRAATDKADFRGNMVSLLSTLTGDEKVEIERVLYEMDEWTDFSINVRLLHLLYKFRINSSMEIGTPFEFLDGFVRRYLSDHNFADSEGLLADAAERAFEFVTSDHNSFLVSSSRRVLVKRIATQSTEMLCFLAAIHLDDLIFNGDESLYSKLDGVYPHLINKYSKELLLKREKDHGLKPVNIIRDHFDSTDCPKRLKAFLAYLLGRFSSDKAIGESLNILKMQKKTLRRSSQIGLSELEKNVRLTVDRSVEISLIFLGESAEDYIQSLIDFEDKDSINRGFHLAYYGDISYFQEPDMVQKDDAHTSYENTKAVLIHNINSDEKNNSIKNLSVFTLFSLGFARHARPSTEHQSELSWLSTLAEKLLKDDFLFDNVREYVSICCEYFSDNQSPDIVASRYVLRLKELPRTGWNYSTEAVKRHVNKPETIQSHAGHAAYLALVYLPEKSEFMERAKSQYLSDNYDRYDKNEIIRMLLVHDIGEYKEGDIPSPIKTDENRAIEERSVKFLSMLSKTNTSDYKHVKYTSNVFSWWYEFKESSTINAKIAKDFDSIECLIQLEHYVSNSSSCLADEDDFKEGLIANITTDLGKEIATKISSTLSKWKA